MLVLVLGLLGESVDTWLPRENVPPGILHVSHHRAHARAIWGVRSHPASRGCVLLSSMEEEENMLDRV